MHDPSFLFGSYSDPDAHALALLARAVYFAPSQPIPRELLRTTIAWAAEGPYAALQAEDAQGRLRDLGLLEPAAVGAVRLHRLLAVFVREIAHDTAAQTAVEDKLIAEAERLLNAGYPGPLLALHPHLRAVTEAAQPRADGRTARLDMTLGNALYLLGDYAGAQPPYERALALHERLLGPEHPDTATSLNNLAMLYRVQGCYAAAEPLHQHALVVREQALGPNHPDVATSLNTLAELYRAQGRYAEAEPLYQRALAILEQALGPNHPDVATVRENYTVLLQHRPREVDP
jgi:tetratricopeptide (TPR) repeat protein